MELLHFKEDTTKPENRTNLALLSALQVDPLRAHFLKTLGLPADSIIWPSPNLEFEEFTSSQRPDLVVRDPGVVDVAYVEIELGPENKEQLVRYRVACQVPVFSVVGKEGYLPHDLSLESLREIGRQVQKDYFGLQSYVALELFCRLVEHYVLEGSFRTPSHRAELSDKMRSTPIVQALLAHFGDRVVGIKEGASPGRLLLDTVGEDGLSVRVYSAEVSKPRGGFSVLSITGSDPRHCSFPSLAELANRFPGSKAARNYAQLVASFGAGNVLQLPATKRAKLPIAEVEANVSAIAAAIEELMSH